MDISVAHVFILLGVGCVVGFINVLSGGGSMLTLPILIWLGLDSTVANGTNRIAILMQNVVAIQGFRSKNIPVSKYSIILGVITLLGAIVGASLAIEIPDELFNKILAIVMILVVIATIFNPTTRIQNLVERMDLKFQLLGGLVFFFIGIYGGFIQAGTGLLIMAALTLINHFTLLKANSAKVVIAFVYTLSALTVFVINGQVNLIYGLVLGVGTATGGWIASRWSVKKGDKWIRWFMIVSVCALAVKLWFFKPF